MSIAVAAIAHSNRGPSNGEIRFFKVKKLLDIVGVNCYVKEDFSWIF